MELEEIQKDRALVIEDLKRVNAKYQGVLEYLAVKEKEIKDKETTKEN